MANLFDTSSFTTTEPLSFTAGDRVAWTRVDIGGDYPPASYSLSYTARKEGAGTVSRGRSLCQRAGPLCPGALSRRSGVRPARTGSGLGEGAARATPPDARAESSGPAADPFGPRCGGQDFDRQACSPCAHSGPVPAHGLCRSGGHAPCPGIPTL